MPFFGIGGRVVRDDPALLYVADRGQRDHAQRPIGDYPARNLHGSGVARGTGLQYPERVSVVAHLHLVRNGPPHGPFPQDRPILVFRYRPAGYGIARHTAHQRHHQNTTGDTGRDADHAPGADDAGDGPVLRHYHQPATGPGAGRGDTRARHLHLYHSPAGVPVLPESTAADRRPQRRSA